MTTLTLRATKGSPLTNNEIDANFTSLSNSKLEASSNLSDLTSAATARTNLGLGSAAVLASSAVLQSANNLSDLASAATARTNLGLGSVAVLASSAVLQSANNLSDLASAATARTNLGLGSVAVLASSAVLQSANNLSDLASAATARTNLSLVVGTHVQAWDADLDAIAAIAASGYLKRTGVATWSTSATVAWADLTSTPTTLSGYGITNGQPLDSDLTAIAALTPSNDDIMQCKAGAWTNRTMAQLASDLNVSTAFSAITAGTNTAVLVIGTGGSLGVSGSGTIVATTVTTITAANIAAALGGEDNLTAHAGGTQAAALALSSTVYYHRITTCVTAGDSVILAAATVAKSHYVRNDGATQLALYAALTETINGIASATGIRLNPGTGIYLNCTTAGAWTTTPTLTGTGSLSVVIGPGAAGAGLESTAIGSTASAPSSSSVSIGSRSVSGANGVAVGFNASSTGDSVAIGDTTTTAGGAGNVSIGHAATSAGLAAIAVGYQAAAGHQGAIVLGRGTASTAASQFVVGGNTNGYDTITDVYMGTGVTNATPGNIKHHASGGVGTDKVGGTYTITSGKGTGAGLPALIKIDGDALGGVTGTTAHTQVNRVSYNAVGSALTSGVAASLFDIPLAASPSSAGGHVLYTIRADDGTNIQSTSGIIRWSARRTGGGPTYAGTTSLDTEALTSSSGTLTSTWALVAGTNKMTMQVTATSTVITPTTFEIVYEVHSQGRSDVNAIPF